MQGGRDHLHHRLVDAGLPVNYVVLMMAALQLCMVSAGVLANPYPQLEPFLFVGFVAIVILYHLALLPVMRALSTRVANATAPLAPGGSADDVAEVPGPLRTPRS